MLTKIFCAEVFIQKTKILIKIVTKNRATTPTDERTQSKKAYQQQIEDLERTHTGELTKLNNQMKVSVCLLYIENSLFFNFEIWLLKFGYEQKVGGKFEPEFLLKFRLSNIFN